MDVLHLINPQAIITTLVTALIIGLTTALIAFWRKNVKLHADHITMKERITKLEDVRIKNIEDEQKSFLRTINDVLQRFSGLDAKVTNIENATGRIETHLLGRKE